MKSRLILALAAIGLAACSSPKVAAPHGTLVDLYGDEVRGYSGPAIQEDTIVASSEMTLFNVQKPQLEVYLPKEGDGSGSAMLVCPGGGFSILSYTGEGQKVAKALSDRGIAAFVLKYRLNPILDDQGNPLHGNEAISKFVTDFLKTLNTEDTDIADIRKSTSYQAFNTPCTPLALEDADHAMRYIREHAHEYGIRKDRIGIMGFSAGAIISLNQALEHSEESKPDFTGLIYGGYYQSPDIPKDAPPLFMCSPVNDVFDVQETVLLLKAWKKAGIPVELHYHHNASHGFGASKDGSSKDNWMDEMVAFMKDVDFIR